MKKQMTNKEVIHSCLRLFPK